MLHKTLKAAGLARNRKRSMEDGYLLLPCPIRKFSGRRCLGCGITHALFAIKSGDLARAFKYNPFVFILAPLLLWGIFDAGRHVAEILWSTNNHGVTAKNGQRASRRERA